MPQFSVIIPLYNKENFIEATLKSVLDQTFNDFEIIIVNDCSTDESLITASKIIDSRIKIIRHPFNKGLSASRNTGIQEAKSNYIAFLDADDLWEPFFLEEIYKLIQNYPKAKIYGTSYIEINKVGKNQKIKKNDSLKEENTYLIDNFFTLNIQQPIYCPSSVTFHKEAFNNSGIYDEKITYAEDIDFNIRVNINNTLAYSNRECVKYLLLSENQITTSSLKNKIIPDFKKYENLCDSQNNLKKYLDFNRYVIAKIYKETKLKKEFENLKQEIDYKNINFKQRFLLESPVFINHLIGVIKQFLLKFNIKIASYD